MSVIVRARDQAPVDQDDLQFCPLPLRATPQSVALIYPWLAQHAPWLPPSATHRAPPRCWRAGKHQQAISRVLAPVARSVAPGLDLLTPGRCELREGVLWIAVDSAAESAKLRQAVPRLLAELVAHGMQVYEMKTRVQAGNSTYPGQGTAGPSSIGLDYPPVTARGASAVQEAADHMPTSALQSALRRLAATLDRRRERT